MAGPAAISKAIMLQGSVVAGSSLKGFQFLSPKWPTPIMSWILRFQKHRSSSVRTLELHLPYILTQWGLYEAKRTRNFGSWLNRLKRRREMIFSETKKLSLLELHSTSKQSRRRRLPTWRIYSEKYLEYQWSLLGAYGCSGPWTHIFGLARDWWMVSYTAGMKRRRSSRRQGEGK